MVNRFSEGVLFAIIVWLAFHAFTYKPSGERHCWFAGNPGSYICEYR